MKYETLLSRIKKQGYKRILVTGAHRSGTTFAGVALAHDLGQPFYPEENIRGGNLVLMDKFVKTHPRFIMQAPGLSVNCHKVDVDLVIFMKRNFVDTIEGMKILSGRVIQYEFDRIVRMYGEQYGEYSLPEAKFRVFKDIQAPLIKNYAYLDYESLEGHALWTPENERQNWHIRQTAPNR